MAKRTHPVMLSLTDDEWHRLEAQAASSGLPHSILARVAMLSGLDAMHSMASPARKRARSARGSRA